MFYRVLHLVDHWLPETMNWLDALLNTTCNTCEHFIFCEYLSSDPPPNYKLTRPRSRLSYPVSALEQIKQRLRRPQMAKHLNLWLEGNDVDVIHVHFGHMAIRYKNLLIQTKKPIAISLYGFDYEFLVFKDPLVLKHYRELSDNGAVFIVEGNYSKQLLIRYGIPKNRISTVHLLFQRHQSVSFIAWKQPIRLLQVATYTEKKNQLGLLEALQERHVGKYTFSFYGESFDVAYMNELKRVVNAKHKHSIALNGKLSFNEYRNKISDSHFCVQWSKRSRVNDTEGGCPVFIKDSLSLGRPIIGSTHCDIPDILVHGLNAYLTEEQDRNTLIYLLDEMLRMNANAYLHMQRNSIQSVQENIAGNISAHELLEAYRRTISQKEA